MASKTLALSAALALAACAPTVFDRPPGVDEAQFHRDNLSCGLLAKQFVGDSFVMGPPLIVAAAQSRRDRDMRSAHDECMLGKSYTIHKD